MVQYNLGTSSGEPRGTQNRNQQTIEEFGLEMGGGGEKREREVNMDKKTSKLY